jgi:hypothetical protein
MAGWPLSTVSEVLGHRKQSITSDTYSHVLTEEPDWLLDQLKEQIRDGSVMARPHPPGVEGYTLAGRAGGPRNWVPLGAVPERRGPNGAGAQAHPTDPAGARPAAGHGHVAVGAGDALTITGYHLHPQ